MTNHTQPTVDWRNNLKARIHVMRQGGMEISPALALVILKEAEFAYKEGYARGCQEESADCYEHTAEAYKQGFENGRKKERANK